METKPTETKEFGIKKLEVVKDTSKKSGKPYVLYKIQGTDGGYYSAFEFIGNKAQLENLRKDMILTAEVEAGERPKQFTIKKISQIALAPASPQTSPKEGPADPTQNEAGLPSPLSGEDIAKMLQQSLKMAIDYFSISPQDISIEHDIVGYIFKAKLQSQHQGFEIQMAKHKEAVWNKK